jgi:hypothetical protein
MSDFYTGAGATFSISAAAPATYDSTGYAALTFTPVGKVTNIGDVPSRVYQKVDLAFLASRAMSKAKGGYDLGNQSVTYAYDPADAGQILANTATNSDVVYSIRVFHPTLGTIYARALIMGGPITYGDNNTPATKKIDVEYTAANTTTDGVVIVP